MRWPGCRSWCSAGCPGEAASELLAASAGARVDGRVSAQIVSGWRGTAGAGGAGRGLTPAELTGEAPLSWPLRFGGRLEELYLVRMRAFPADTRMLLLLAAADPWRGSRACLQGGRPAGNRPGGGRGSCGLAGTHRARGRRPAPRHPCRPHRRGLANANPGFPSLAAAAAHSQGLTARNAGLLAVAEANHPDPWARASAAEDLAGILTSTAKDQAIRHLKTALDGYRQTGAGRDQARIRRRLRELGVRRRHWTTPATRPVAGWDSLTDTEQAVSRLVAEGLNNNQIAARMYISTHTVAHHLRQAFRKLQIASRVELARIVIEEAAAGS